MCCSSFVTFTVFSTSTSSFSLSILLPFFSSISLHCKVWWLHFQISSYHVVFSHFLLVSPIAHRLSFQLAVVSFSSFHALSSTLQVCVFLHHFYFPSLFLLWYTVFPFSDFLCFLCFILWHLCFCYYCSCFHVFQVPSYFFLSLPASFSFLFPWPLWEEQPCSLLSQLWPAIPSTTGVWRTGQTGQATGRSLDSWYWERELEESEADISQLSSLCMVCLWTLCISLLTVFVPTIHVSMS